MEKHNGGILDLENDFVIPEDPHFEKRKPELIKSITERIEREEKEKAQALSEEQERLWMAEEEKLSKEALKP